jgi:hypothetical protein
MRFLSSRSLRYLAIGLAWVALTTTFFFPTKEAMDTTLDFSNYGSYSYFTAQGSHYGSEVIPMCGPFGFVLYGFVYGGDLFWLRLGLEVLLKAVLAGLALWVWFSAARTPVLRFAWLACLVLFMCAIEDYPYDWLIFLAGVWIIRQTQPDRGGWRAEPLAAVLGLVALVKGTHLVLAFATLGTALLPALWRRDWRRLATVLGSFAVSLLACWLLAGQRVADLPAYVRGILELSSGYNLAMTLDESAATFWRGASLVLVLLGLYALGGWLRRRQPATLAGLALIAGFTFLKWKHGFVRSDGHIFVFFCFAAVAASTWLVLLSWLEPDGAPLTGWPRRVALACSAGALVLAHFGLGSGKLQDSRWVYQWYPGWFAERARGLANPVAKKAALDAKLVTNRRLSSMPLTRERVGDGTIDMFGFEHGILRLNGLNYAPRPIGGGAFSTFTPYLMELNGAFMDDPARRPDFFVLKYQTVDNRLAAQDDPLTFRGLLHYYSPVEMEQNYVLLQRQESGPAPAPVPLKTVAIRFDETIEVPAPPPGQMLLASFDIRLSLSGRVRSALYKPPLIFIHQTGQGLVHPDSRRLVPSMARIPFPFSPVIESNEDVLTLYTRQEGKPLHSFRLSTALPAAFDPDMTVTFHTLPRPRVPDRVNLDEMITATRYPLTNVPPESISPPDAPVRPLGGISVQMMLPPAELVWKLEGNERELLFDYGYHPTAYDEKSGNGTLVIVELRPPDRPPQELFRRLLNPAHRPADRDTQSARVILPNSIRPGSRLALRTDPGEFNDNAWDWTYVTRIQLKRGEYSARQFPGFNRVPTLANIEHAGLLDTEQGQILLLHAPGSVDYLLRGDESSLRFDFGFMPGAYTGEGATDGARFVVELARPNQPRETVFQRQLAPRARPEDQGRQHAAITLPKLGPADHLILTIDPGPTGNNAWDWTYVTNFVLQ